FDAQSLARGGETEEHRRRLATARRADAQPVLPTNSYPFHLTLGDIVVYGQEPGLGVTHQRGPVVQRVADRLPPGSLGRHLRPLPRQPLVELLQDRRRQVLAHL